MGWASLLEDIVREFDSRFANEFECDEVVDFYLKLIDMFEAMGCDTICELRGVSEDFDKALDEYEGVGWDEEE